MSAVAEKLLTELMERVERIELATAEIMDTKQAAKYLSISESTLNKLSRPSNMVIPVAVFGGKKKLFQKKDLLAFIDQHKSKPINQ